MKTQTQQKTLSDKRIQQTLEQLWLTYFNDTLLAKKLITEEQWHRMRLRILQHTSDANHCGRPIL